ncbi:unnamed protein product [Linum trigynum]|uniref:Protein kinase domain-containing protein n=1 Tax=Linum trigynum TaxID=586398 RepID=A0AAV2CFB2_9ROSI
MAIASRKLNYHLSLHLNPTPAIRHHHRFSPYPTTSSSSSSSSSSHHHQEVKRLTDLEKVHLLDQGSSDAVFKVRHRTTRAIYALKKIISPETQTLEQEVAIHRLAYSSPHVVNF